MTKLPYPSLSLSLQTDSRALYVKQWSSELGRCVLQQLSRLYRALVWEGFILLAVAAGDDKALRESQSQTDSSASDAQTTAGGSSTDSSQSIRTQAQATALPTVLTAETLPRTCTAVVDDSTSLDQESSSPPATTASNASSTVRSKHVPGSQPPSGPVQSLKQLTPLLAVTSRVGGALAELISLLVKLCTSPLHRQHRRAGHGLIAYSYQPPSEDAIAVCLEATNLLVDSMRWEVPPPTACTAAMLSPIHERLFKG